MSLCLSLLPPHLVVSILKKTDLLATVHLATTCSRINELLLISSKNQLDQLAQLARLHQDYIEYSSQVAHWSSVNRVLEALQGKIPIERVFEEQRGPAEKYHGVVAEMRAILLEIPLGDKKVIKERLQLIIARHQPTKKLGEISLNRIRDL